MLIAVGADSNIESPYDVTADDWRAYWHEESEGSSAIGLHPRYMKAGLLMITAERLKTLERLDWYTRPKDFATVGYRGMHQNKIEYSAADRERFNRHRAAFASPNAHKVRPPWVSDAYTHNAYSLCTGRQSDQLSSVQGRRA